MQITSRVVKPSAEKHSLFSWLLDRILSPYSSSWHTLYPSDQIQRPMWNYQYWAGSQILPLHHFFHSCSLLVGLPVRHRMGLLNLSFQDNFTFVFFIPLSLEYILDVFLISNFHITGSLFSNLTHHGITLCILLLFSCCRVFSYIFIYSFTFLRFSIVSFSNLSILNSYLPILCA